MEARTWVLHAGVLMSSLQFPLIIAFDKVEFSFALLAAECWQHDGLVIMFTFRSNESQCISDKIDKMMNKTQSKSKKSEPTNRAMLVTRKRKHIYTGGNCRCVCILIFVILSFPCWHTIYRFLMDHEY